MRRRRVWRWRVRRWLLDGKMGLLLCLCGWYLGVALHRWYSNAEMIKAFFLAIPAFGSSPELFAC